MKQFAHSLPTMKNTSRHSRIGSDQLNSSQPSAFQRSQSPYAKLPVLQISKMLRKIGAGDRKRQMYIPNQQQQASFRKQKLQQLTKLYKPSRYVQKPQFQSQLDQIVIDCWQYGDRNGKKTVWKKYRQICDDISFDTLKLMRKK